MIPQYLLTWEFKHQVLKHRGPLPWNINFAGSSTILVSTNTVKKMMFPSSMCKIRPWRFQPSGLRPLMFPSPVFLKSYYNKRCIIFKGLNFINEGWPNIHFSIAMWLLYHRQITLKTIALFWVDQSSIKWPFSYPNCWQVVINLN